MKLASFRRRLAAALAAAIAAGLLAATPALAHKVIASVYASGDDIEGEIGFSNGDMAADALVEVFDEAGAKLGEATTDADGFFTFTPSKPVAHLFRANLGAGHVANVRMEIDELPAKLHAAAANAGAAEASPPAVDAGQPSDVAAVDVTAVAQTERALIAEMLRQELRPLRREIAAYKEKNDLQTILGGLGYILGLFGLGFYLSAQRKLKKG